MKESIDSIYWKPGSKISALLTTRCCK